MRKYKGEKLVKKHKIWKRVDRAFRMNGRRYCLYCGLSLTSHRNKQNSVTIDRIIARVNGGAPTLWNLAPACARCNSLKSNLSIKEFANKHDMCLSDIQRRWAHGAINLLPIYFEMRDKMLASQHPFKLETVHEMDRAFNITIQELKE